MHNALAARLAAGDRLTALIAKLPCAAQVESAGHAGFDFVILDTEHGPPAGLEEHLRAAAAVGLPALVRVSGPDAILAALDAGADGVVVPHVLDARAAVAAAHYPPRGRRSIALSTRAGRYGAVSLDEHLRRAAEETVVVVQIEDREAAARADEILAVPGVSGALIGAADLSLSLGRPPRAELDAAIDGVIAAARRARVPVMMVAPDTRGQVTAFVAANLIHAAFTQAAAATRPSAGPEPLGILGAAAATRPSAGSEPVGMAGAAAATRRYAGPDPLGMAGAAAATPPYTGSEPVGMLGAAAATRRYAGPEPLVMLPGMLGAAALWDGVAPALADRAGVRFERIDLDDNVPGLAAGVLASAPDRFALAGHSLGAIVALEVVRQAPARVTRLALLNASARPASDAQLAAWAEMRERDFGELAREFAEANLPPHRRDDAELVHRIEAMARSVGPRGLRRQLDAQATRPDSRPSLSAIAVPTLVLTGADDHICPPPLQEELAAGIRGAEHVVVDGAGHMAALEDPAAVAAHMQTWLEGAT